MTYIEEELALGMPDGWWKKFGKKMAKELQTIVDEKEIEDFKILQVKEKYNSLRVYISPYDKDIDDVLRKYEDLSTKYCVMCGKKATKVSKGWYNSFCDECAEKVFGEEETFITIKDWLNPPGIKLS